MVNLCRKIFKNRVFDDIFEKKKIVYLYTKNWFEI